MNDFDKKLLYVLPIEPIQQCNNVIAFLVSPPVFPAEHINSLGKLPPSLQSAPEYKFLPDMGGFPDPINIFHKNKIVAPGLKFFCPDID